MSTTFQVGVDSIFDYIDDESAIEISSVPTKHDCHCVKYVTKVGEKYYMFSVEYSYANGIVNSSDIDFDEVVPKEVTVTEWVKV